MATSHGHGGDFVATGPSHDLGYEPDKFAVKTILAVPVAVIVTGVLAFVVTSLIFSNIFAPSAYDVPPTVSAAAADNAAPLNDRLARMSSTDPNAPIQQPRLEAMNRKQEYPGGMYGTVKGEWITTQPTKDGNSPHYHADDLRTDQVKATSTFAKDADPAIRTVRIPVEMALAIAADPTNAEFAKALSAAPGATRLDTDPRFGWDRPKESNGGKAYLPEPAKPAEPKKEELKKDEPKKQ